MRKFIVKNVIQNDVSPSPKIACNQKGHENEVISKVCLRAECKEQRAYCKICDQTRHLQCVGEIIYFEKIHEQISLVHGKIMEINNIIHQIISELKNQVEFYNSIIKCTKIYSDAPNLASLNEIVVLLNFYSPLNIQKLREGKELIDKVIQDHFLSETQITQIQEIQQKQKNYTNSKISQLSCNNNNLSTNTSSTLNLKNSDISSSLANNQTPKNSNPNPSSINSDNNKKAISFLNEGIKNYESGNYQKAVEFFDKVITLNPDNHTAWYRKGIALNKLDRDFESIECFRRAREIINQRPQIDKEVNSSYIGNIASTLTRLGQFQDSIKLIDEGLALDPTNQNLFKLKIKSLINFNKLPEALKFVNQAIELDPRNYKALQLNGIIFSLVGRILLSLKKFDEAIEKLTLSHTIKVKKQTYLILGKVLQYQGKLGDAEHWCNEALKINENYQDAQKLLESIKQQKRN